MSNITDISGRVPGEKAKQAAPAVIEPPASGDPRDYTVEQLQAIVQQGQEAVQALLNATSENALNLVNASQQLGSMRMLLAIKLEEEANDE